MYAPASAAYSAAVRGLFDVLDLRSDVKVGGKRRFWRALIRRKK